LMVFSNYISLKKSGNRYRALCPFHSEKTPSFYAHENGMFHCFGCGVGGDVVKFVMLMEKMDFKDCATLLSTRYGVPLRFTSTGERKEKEELLHLMTQATEFYHNLLVATPEGKPALDYLDQRGITRDTIKRFHLGWAPASWNALLEHFQKKDVDPVALEKCGLVVARQREGFYDRYRSRIMIPIRDIHGNTVALGGRLFGEQPDQAKYLNSPETSLYSKSHHLFGLYFSKEQIQHENSALLVEGYFDMILPYQAGVSNIVASLGTSLTEAQSRLLRRYTDRIIILYDPDTAGQSAVMRALPILLKENFSVRVAHLPDGKDPDQYLREFGLESFQEQVGKAIPYDQLFLNTLVAKYDLKSPGGKLAASDELVGLLSLVANPFEREQIMNQFASSLAVPVQLLQEQFRRRQKSTGAAQRQLPDQQKMNISEKSLLQICLSDLVIARQLLTELTDEDFEEFVRPELFRTLQQCIENMVEASPAEVIHTFPVEQQDLLTALILASDTPAPSLEYGQEWLRKIRATREERFLRQLDNEIEAARQRSDNDALNMLLLKKTQLGRKAKAR
jgi:DNA primase